MKSITRYILITIFSAGFTISSYAGNIVGTVKAKGVKNSADAVIYIEKIAGKTFSAPKEHAKMDQKNLKFHPHVLPILAGTTVDFLNSDDVLHNVFSPDPCADKMRDSEGYYWFVGRADDVIKSSGHLIGPFEVESALMEHKAVAEAGVIGIPEPTAGEIVKAYVALKSGFEPSEALRKELLGHARQRLGPAVAPKDIAFRQNLPKTRSGKIMRRLLKARELGLPEGDISTLESEER